MEKSTVCSFTGHRPEKLPDNGDASSQSVMTLKSFLYGEIVSAVDDGYDTFITGMARGVDLWAGEFVADMILSGKKLRLKAVYPHKGYEKLYYDEDRCAVDKILSAADEILYLYEKYYKGCMAVRNNYLVEQSSRLIAVVGAYSSGTGQTISFAKKRGMDIRIIDINKVLPSVDGQLCIF